MTYEEFIVGADDYYENSKLNESKGKAYMSFLYSHCFSCYEYITGTELDPTYSSRRLPGFLLFVQHHIEKF